MTGDAFIVRSEGASDLGVRNWPKTFAVIGIGTGYVCAFWGRAATLLPAPLDEWHSLGYRLFHSWWRQYAPSALNVAEQAALYQVAEALVVGLILPIFILRRYGYSARNMGLGAAADPVWPLVALGGLTLPVGFWLSKVVPNPWETPLKEALGFLFTVPEHFLIFGVFGVLLLPGRRLAWPVSCPPRCTEVALVVTATAALFGLIHIGASIPELSASVFFGLVFAFMTLRSASIWPALIAHWMLNLLPMAWDALTAGS